MQWQYICIVVQPAPFSISETFSSSRTEVLYPFNNNSLLPSPENHSFTPIYLYEFYYSRYLIWFGIVQYLSLVWVYFTLHNILRFVCVVTHIRISFFFKAEHYSIICVHRIVSIHSSKHIGIVSTFWLLWVMLLWAWVYGIYSSVCLNKWGMHPEVELRNYY